MKFVKFGIAMIAMSFTVSAYAGNPPGFAWGIDTTQSVYYVNLSNASSTVIGVANGGFYECLGMAPSGLLYGITTNGELYSISTSNAAATLIGDTGLGNIEGMDWDAANGRMLISDFSQTPSIYSINLGNASTQLLQTATSTATVIRTLATRSSSSVLDIRSDVSTQGDVHGTFDMGSGAYGNIGSPVDPGSLAMDYGDDGQLYGLTSNGQLVTINPGTGAFQSVGNVNDNAFFLGMATNVVPEPATLAVLGLGVAALARRRRRSN